MVHILIVLKRFYVAVRQKQEERKSKGEINKEKDRKRKRDKYAEKVIKLSVY